MGFLRTALIGLVLLVSPTWQQTPAGGPSPMATANIDPSHPGQPIQPEFMGFSHEWTGGPQLMGSPARGTNPIYRQLIENLLEAAGGGPFVLRVGGNSTDLTGEPSPGMMDPFAQLATDLGVQFVLGVNLGKNDLTLAVDQARAYVQGMPAGSIQAIEIGNEPDLFHDNGLRPPAYAYADYAQEFAQWRSALEPVLPPGMKLMGPSWSSAASLRNLPAFLDQAGQSVGVVSQHWYAGTQCNGRTNPPDFLLRDSTATSGARSVAAAVTLSHQRNLPFRMGEMNSISCGGEAGVSDIFASALWAADSLFELANVGVDGVNIHTGNGGGYALFSFTSTNTDGLSEYAVQSIRPEYYGLLFFQQAAEAGSRLVPVTLSTTADLKVWATLDGSGTVRVAVINKDRSASGEVSLRLASPNPGELTRLEAPTFDAQTGITLGGQSFDGTPDGTLQGRPATERIVPQAGAYTFSVASVSAALLTVPAGARASGTDSPAPARVAPSASG